MSESQPLAIMPAEHYRLATDTAGLCRDIVTKTAVEIQGRKYVRVEGWMAIATAHGCVASAGDVKQDEKGVSAIAEVRRLSDGVVLCRAEGFVGADEPTWYGGVKKVWDTGTRAYVEKHSEKRADYAIRAMAQTRAISRVCRTAFAHVVVMMEAGLQTTPAEEIQHEDQQPTPAAPKPVNAAPRAVSTSSSKPVEVPRTRADFKLPDGVKWQDVAVHFGKNRGRTLGELEDNVISWYLEKWDPTAFSKGAEIGEQDKMLVAAVNAWADEQDARQ